MQIHKPANFREESRRERMRWENAQEEDHGATPAGREADRMRRRPRVVTETAIP